MNSSECCDSPLVSGGNHFLSMVKWEVLEDLNVPSGGAVLSDPSPDQTCHINEYPAPACIAWMAKKLDIQ